MASPDFVLTGLGAGLPVIAAPMAGGAGTSALAVAAARAGGLGFVAAGYLTAEALAGRIAEVRATGVSFGVNLFAPDPVLVDRVAYRRYAAEITPEAAAVGAGMPDEPREDDDAWAAKTDLLLADPVPLVSITFGIPDAGLVARLRSRGTVVVLTVTSAAEARAAAAAGPDALVVQAASAGGHSATLDPGRPPPVTPLPALLREVGAAVTLPLIGAGGVGDAADVVAALGAGAHAVMVGTALLRSDESGASAIHRDALVAPGRGTVLTRAFTGRPARALRNGFVDRHDATAPLGYPALHHLTGPMRRAAAAAGDADRMHLWAGTGHARAATGPAGEILRALSARS